LKLAAASADGFVRVYEAVDITNLSQWQITDQFEVCDSSTGGVNCIDWNTSPLEHQSIAVGSNESVAKIYQYNDKLRKWEVSVVLSGHEGPIHDIAWAPSMGRSYHLLATASKDYTLRVWRLDYVKGKYEPKCIGVFKDHGTEVRHDGAIASKLLSY
jgi:nucleoporin SEH1